MLKMSFFAALAVVILFSGGSVSAVSTTWTNGTGNQKWQDAGNWNFGVPGSLDRAYISLAGTSRPVVALGVTAAANRVYLGQVADGALEVSGANLTVTDRIYAGNSGFTGTIDIASGTIVVTGKMFIGYSGPAAINITGGYISSKGVDLSSSTAAGGHLQLDGGTYFCDGLFTVYAGGNCDITRGKLKLAGSVSSLAGMSGYGVPGAVSFDYDSATNTTMVTALPSVAPYAYQPNPADSAQAILPDIILSWTPSRFAAIVNGHDVYFGTSLSAVGDANHLSAEFQGRQDANSFNPGLLSLDTTYYWRIDEVNDANVWKGEVWSFKTDSGYARNPYPSDKAAEVPRDIIFAWSPGALPGAFHNIYIGTVWTDVNSASPETHPNVMFADLDTNSFDAGQLEWNTTYYWRVDQVNGAEVWKGNIWRFTTVEQNITFFVAADCHYGIGDWAGQSNQATIDRMNSLAGVSYPSSVGNGLVQPPRGVLVAGDLVNNGSDSNGIAQFSQFESDWGINGEGRLKFEVYEGFGNQDGDAGSAVRQAVKNRNLLRIGLSSISSNGLHYSWDWEQVHFINLNLCPGDSGTDNSGLAAQYSLEFLQADLAENVGESGRAVVILCHYGFDSWGLSWWPVSMQQAFYDRIKEYNVIGIFHGHSHTTSMYAWNGFDVYSVPAAQSQSGAGKFLAVNIKGNNITVAERVGDAWGMSRRKAVSIVKPPQPSEDAGQIRGLGEPFTIVALPDTQKYCASFPTGFYSQTQWLKDHKDEINCKFVLHEGDIVDSAGSESQWIVANTAMSTLDGVLPYCMVPGNHDGSGGFYAKYFPVSRYSSYPWFGGNYGNNYENSYHFFTVGSMKFLIMCLRFGPGDLILQWANNIVAQYPNHRVIVLTHSYLENDGRTLTPEGQNIWEKFVRKHKNIFVVLNGHLSVARRTSIGDNGNTVYELLADYQGLDNGGDGWLRIMKFVPARNVIEVRTFSTYLNKFWEEGDGRYSTAADNNFDLPYMMENVLSVTGYETIWQKRISRTVFEYGMKMKVRNIAENPLKNINLQLVSTPDNINVLNDKIHFSFVPALQESLNDDTFIVRIDRSVPVDVNDIVWQVCEDREGDVNGDGIVDGADLNFIVANWLSPDFNNPSNLFKDLIINFSDFGIFANNWQQGGPVIVNIISPADGAVFDFNQVSSVELAAEAVSSDSPIKRVEFFVNGVKVGEDNDSNNGWKVNWQGFKWDSSNTYKLTAKAIDSNESSQTSPEISVTVDYEPPLISIVSPSDGQLIDVNSTTGIIIQAQTVNGDGQVNQVEFFSNGTSLAVDKNSSDGWILNWQKITQDTYVLTVDLTVQATDNNGAAAVSQPVRITTRKQTAN